MALFLGGIVFQGAAMTQESDAELSGVRSAVVQEMLIAGSYVYMRVLENEQDVWLATAPEFVKGVSYGQSIEFVSDVEMQDFHSQGLDRTFDSIWFVSRIRTKPAAMPVD